MSKPSRDDEKMLCTIKDGKCVCSVVTLLLNLILNLPFTQKQLDRDVVSKINFFMPQFMPLPKSIFSHPRYFHILHCSSNTISNGNTRDCRVGNSRPRYLKGTFFWLSLCSYSFVETLHKPNQEGFF